ncbi:MAG: hypothetical protein ACXQTI_02705 [Candidatus Nezhaarchaeales archaeon]
MSVVAVDQREVQRRGGLYSKYPASAVVAELLKLCGGTRVLDVTYGEGRFYKLFKPRLLVGCDVAVYDWLVAPDLFILKPVWAVYEVLRKSNLTEFDVLVVDPPWGANHHKRPQFNLANAWGTPRIIVDEAFKLAEKLGTSHLLLHFSEVVEKQGWTRVRAIEFTFASRCLSNPGFSRSTYFMLFRRKVEVRGCES